MRSCKAVLSLALFPLLIATGCTKATGSFDRTLTVAGTPNVHVNCPVGSVIIRGGKPGTVAVSGSLEANTLFPNSTVRKFEENPPVHQYGTRIVIGEENRTHIVGKLNYTYEIVVPTDATVESNVGVGKHDISGLSSSLELNTGVGSVQISDYSGNAQINTGVGKLDADHFSGKVTVNQGTGGIRIRGNQLADSVLDLNTGTGAIDVSELKGGIHAKTGVGDVHVGGNPGAAWNIESGTGKITLNVPPEAKFNIDIDSGAGAVNCARTINGNIARGRIQGSVNGGGPTLRAHVGAGTIDVN